MRIDVYHHTETNSEVLRLLQAILTRLERMERREIHMSKEIEELGVELTEIEGADASIIALLDGFADYVEAHRSDPVVLQGYIDRLRAQKEAIRDAVLANPLPADPVDPPPPA